MSPAHLNSGLDESSPDGLAEPEPAKMRDDTWTGLAGAQTAVLKCGAGDVKRERRSWTARTLVTGRLSVR
jgi:hypothetical protein